MNKKMFCPVCKSELIVVGRERLETLVEHVECREPSLKDVYVCVCPSCPAHMHKAGVRWNEDGELYTKNFKAEKEIRYIDNNNAPFGSFQRQMNVEIYKHDEDFYLLKIFGWKLKVEYEYKSNENGDILSRKINLLWINPKNCHHISGIHMFFYMINRKNHPAWAGDDHPLRFGNEWWRHAASFFVYVFQRDRYNSWFKK